MRDGLLRQAALLTLLFFPWSVVVALSKTITVNELQSIASASAIKIPGSLSYLRTWRLWSETSIHLMRSDLKKSLSTPVDHEALRELSFQLGMAADVGAMPSFEHEGARAGYAVDYFCRAQLLADLLFVSSEPAFLVDSVEDLLGGGKSVCRLSSLGGGPGYDFVAAAMISIFKAQQRQQALPTAIHATIFDYEHGWSPLVSSMSSSIEATLGGSHCCSFGGCDITVPFSDPINAKCRSEATKTDLWVCSYCVAENARKLRETGYIFFEGLFAEAKTGALFVFTETTHRIWPELTNVALRNEGFDVAFPRSGARGKAGRQMVLRKRVGATVGDEEKELCKEFGRDNEMNENKIHSGRRRQARKIRGAK